MNVQQRNFNGAPSKKVNHNHDMPNGLQSTGESSPLVASTALVTGASSGIGRAIALELARQGANLCVVGRNAEALAETAAAASRFSSVESLQLDITDDHQVASLFQRFEQVEKLDILVHSAGIFQKDLMAQGRVEDLDRQYAINVRAPYVLSQRLLPQLTANRGQIVFINSSAGLAAKRPDFGQYAATKHALKAVADSLREEVNHKGIRVLTVYLGRTATPTQERIFREEGRTYRPETLLQPSDIASVVINALSLPRTAEVTDISIRPMVNFCGSGDPQGT
jgi:NADP-dependent 3-hydroxy acid dehydrogenase YdfG